MGAVYRVSDTFEMRQVALKVLSITYQQMDEETAIERFRREARYAHQLQHKNIVPVINFGSDGGILYLVMPLITGGTVKALLKGEHPLPIAQARQYLNDLADAIEAVHTHPLQIVHRDIKPSNLLLHQDDGRLVVTDFGIARAMQQEKPLTQRGWSLGTEHYIAPEQEQGKAEPASDIYAMGVVAYQFMTGLLPFQAVVRGHAAELPPPSTLNSWLPPSVDAVILRAIETDPRKRFQSARAFADALNDALTAGTSPDASALTITVPTGVPSSVNILVRVLIPENPCPSCGRENRSNSRFCRYCGHNVDETSQLQMEACEAGYFSVIGQNAQENEDMLLVAQGLGINLAPPPHSFGLFAVADGLRGKQNSVGNATPTKATHVKGREASRLGIETLADTVLPLLATTSKYASQATPQNGHVVMSNTRSIQAIRPPTAILEQWLQDGVRQANRVIYHCNADYETAMGSTLTTALVHNHRLYIAHVGDSRAYHFSTKTGLHCLTHDHTLAGDLVEAKLLQADEIYKSAKRNQHHRYLGNTYQVQVDLLQRQIESDDIVLLCTDGLWNMMRDKQIENVLVQGGDAQSLACTLVETASRSGSEGNTSAIVLRIL
jgi:serine/threonine protein kinase